jgi:predicted ABC-type ATPase
MENTANVYIIAGPNGSDKTTFAKTFLPEYSKYDRFINADLIAAGLSPPETFLPMMRRMILMTHRQFRKKKENL